MCNTPNISVKGIISLLENSNSSSESIEIRQVLNHYLENLCVGSVRSNSKENASNVAESLMNKIKNGNTSSSALIVIAPTDLSIDWYLDLTNKIFESLPEESETWHGVYLDNTLAGQIDVYLFAETDCSDLV